MTSNIKTAADMNSTPASLLYDRQPYYIVAPPYDETKFRSRVWHELCSYLNQSGYAAYIESSNIHGGLWTPPLTATVKTAHYKAHKNPIVIYSGNHKSDPLGLGVLVRYIVDSYSDDSLKKPFISRELVYECQFNSDTTGGKLYFPTTDVDLFSAPQSEVDRNLALVFIDRYAGPRCHPDAQAIEITATHKKSQQELADLCKKSKVLYLYEWSILAIEARLCGCAVVFIPNGQCLPKKHPALDFYGNGGAAWGLELAELAQAQQTVGAFRSQYLAAITPWSAQFDEFVNHTQSVANLAAIESVWPQQTVDSLPGIYTEPKDMAACCDRRKWQKLNDQYQQWSERSSLREIDAQIYAELAVGGTLPLLSVVIDHRWASSHALADTLDSLTACLGQATEVIIVSNQQMPEVFGLAEGLRWIQIDGLGLKRSDLGHLCGDCLILVQAGTKFTPQALIEWAWASTTCSAALIYADEDVAQADGSNGFAHFKPDSNIELLRCTNYLGTAVLVRPQPWLEFGLPLFDGGLYRYALVLLDQYGKAGLGHVDTVLFHALPSMSAKLENQEFEAASTVLSGRSEVKSLQPLDRWGTWLVEYASKGDERVSLVIPTGLQTGYLRSFLEALVRFPEPSLVDIVLVCLPAQVDEVRFVISDIAANLVQIVPFAQDAYNHAAALNAGIDRAVGDYVLVADDDTEPLHANWLSLLLGVLAQPDVACVAPRLVASRDKDTKLVGGPMVLGIHGVAGSYLGEEQRIEEVGVYSRLQLTQDVSAVAGHLFLVRKADWATVGGFDSNSFGLHFPVLDFCLRLSQLGKRHVWTPLVGVLHHGGKTLSSLRRDVRQHVLIAESEIQERENLLRRWAPQLASDPNYNRHLSLRTAFDIEADIVVDWQPKRHDRPRTMAVPLHSGAGQYRVIEPLNALQDAGLAQSCVVLPLARGQHRVLQPLEVVRAAPDRLILQHSVDDGQLRQIEHYRLAMPGLKIVQMVDDLFGEVPEKHPNRQFQSREGHQRMMQALTLSDRLVVTTQPLLDHYQRYVSDVRIVPNALASQWLGLCKLPRKKARLRVGWVGAGQHHGDLEVITEVVRVLSKEVDWIFMGMCTDDIKPLLKEFHPFVSIADYPKKMAELDLDIAIAPLEDNIFNRCKSNLRLLEYGAMGWPVVCSDVYPYRTDDPPVIRVQNTFEAWVDAIRSLLNDEKREQYATALNQWLHDRYLLSNYKNAWISSIFDN